jgi:FMN phosphatase YigB (HAD superfamily)
MSDQDYLEHLAKYLKLPTHKEACQAHLGFLQDPYSGTLELVNDIHRAGLRTACLSNTEEWHWQKMISSLYPAVQAIQNKMASHILNARKPDPEIFLAASRLVSVPPSTVVYFDDVAGNVEGAIKAGWEAYLIDKTGDTAAQMRAILGL